jgi:ketosteroid isomerase-like protein
MQSALETIHEYYKAFSTLDAPLIVPYYCEPSMTVAPQGVLSAASHAALADSLAPFIKMLKSRGYGRSEFVEANVATLGEADALVRGVAVRYTAAGPELERVPLSYLMHLTKAGWKITVLVVEQ